MAIKIEEVAAQVDDKFMYALEVLGRGDTVVQRAHEAVTELPPGPRSAVMRHVAGYVRDAVRREVAAAEHKRAEEVHDSEENGVSFFMLSAEGADALGHLIQATSMNKDEVINHSLRFFWAAMKANAELEEVGTDVG